MKYLIFICMLTSANVFAGKQEIEKKFQEVLEEQKEFTKDNPLYFKTFDDEYHYRDGYLDGLKFALEQIID